MGSFPETYIDPSLWRRLGDLGLTASRLINRVSSYSSDRQHEVDLQQWR